MDDGWLEQLLAIDVSALEGTPAEATYGFARERMEAIAARRVCKMDWWNISPTCPWLATARDHQPSMGR